MVLESRNIFLPGKCQGLFQNLFLIIAAIVLYNQNGVIVLVFAFLLSIIIQCLFEMFFVTKYWKVVDKNSIDKSLCTQDVKSLVGLTVPLMLGNSIYEINDIVDKQIGTLLGEGRVSILTYSASVNEIVTGVVVSSIATVLFAHFSSLAAEKNIKKITVILDNAINGMYILILPIMVMCIVCGKAIISILYGRGNFGEEDVIATYYVVIGYAIGFIFQAWRSILSRVFYAFQNTKIPMINGMIAVIINVILSYTFSRFIGVSGIAYATSVAMLFSTILLLLKIKKYLPDYSLLNSIKELLKALFSAIIVGVILYLFNIIFSGKDLAVFLSNGILCVSGYIVLLYIFRSKYIFELIDFGRNRVKKFKSKG